MAILLIGLLLFIKSDTNFAFRQTNVSSSNLENQLETNTHCLKYDYQIQDTLASTKPPFDNYFNISRAIYPSEELSSKLINIWVHLTNSSTNLTEVSLRKFIWSRSCLYVSDRYLNLRAISLYSLGSIWPDRRQEILHITIPIFCNEEASEQKLVDFLSTLEDIAVIPAQLNPVLNRVECVVEEKAPGFELPKFKKTFPHICWAFWFFSIIAGYFATVVFIQLLQEPQKDVVVKGTLPFLLTVFYVGLLFGILAIVYSTKGYKMAYPFIYLFTMGLAYILGYVYCLNSLNNNCTYSKRKLAHVYPSSFVMIHSILWMMVGMITEPYWAIPVVTSHAVAVCLFYLLLGFCYSGDREWDIRDKINLMLLFILLMSVMSVQFLFFLVGYHFFNEGLISSLIPGVLIVILGVWYKHFKNSSQESRRESPDITTPLKSQAQSN